MPSITIQNKCCRHNSRFTSRRSALCRGREVAGAPLIMFRYSVPNTYISYIPSQTHTFYQVSVSNYLFYVFYPSQIFHFLIFVFVPNHPYPIQLVGSMKRAVSEVFFENLEGHPFPPIPPLNHQSKTSLKYTMKNGTQKNSTSNKRKTVTGCDGGDFEVLSTPPTPTPSSRPIPTFEILKHVKLFIGEYTILYYTTLHYTTLHYTTLHCTTLHCTALHYTTLHYTTLDTTLHSTLHYTTLHFTALHYTTLHCTTLHYTTLHCTTLHYRSIRSIQPTSIKRALTL